MFNLTSQERSVVLFIIATVLLSVGFDYCRKLHSPIFRLSFMEEESARKININTADKEVLMSVKGIGETIAQRILDYRQKFGRFDSEEELKEVKGISDYKFERLKGSICAD